MFRVFPSCNYFSSVCSIKSEVFNVANWRRIFQDTGCNDSQTYWENLWVLIYLVVSSSRLESSQSLRSQKSSLQINGFFIVRMFIWIWEQASYFHLTIAVNKYVFRFYISNPLIQFMGLILSTCQNVKKIPKIRLSKSLLLLMSICDLFRE